MRVVIRNAEGALIDIADPSHIGAIADLAEIALCLWREVGLSPIPPETIRAMHALDEIKLKVERQAAESTAAPAEVLERGVEMSAPTGDDWVDLETPVS